ncbi:hypothetical protein IGI04_007216 [Brassica rapa subsp. trilocularis]|uniref:Uncharacterized protein n=1 Tax=Brassica rapa subsp. trilocularis TaxID=1813537 RepID=A0ABQ7NJ30_BRACM|nr:hypothetical protein IGI04_007216 [Brassica rapa subsp. trilocularis]
MDHGTKQAVQLVRSALFRCRTAQTRQTISDVRFIEGWTEDTIQLGGWPSWIEHATISAIRRAGLIQFSIWPSWNDRAVFISSSQLPPPPPPFGIRTNLLLFHLDRSHRPFEVLNCTYASEV